MMCLMCHIVRNMSVVWLGCVFYVWNTYCTCGIGIECLDACSSMCGVIVVSAA